MRCKFASNGLAIDYFGTVKPCCMFRADDHYRAQNHVRQTNLVTWHQSASMVLLREQLAADQWPAACGACEDLESQGRGDSIRLNGEQAYGHYGDQDVTLEIRGGTVCNLACQTCWPQASSRVAQFYRQSGLDFTPAHDMDWDFDLLRPIAHRLKDIVLLGGEPFYDKRCLRLLTWLVDSKIQANITIFTNGSEVARDFVRDYQGRLTLVFSIDAVGRPAEYIRFGSDWSAIESHYAWTRSMPGVETRVNITTSPYNYHYLDQLLEWLLLDWPAVVSFGPASQSPNSPYMDESVIPERYRPELRSRLQSFSRRVAAADIDAMQKANAMNALQAIDRNLEDMPWDQIKHDRMLDFVSRMDQVKGVKISDYCPETARYLDINAVRLDRVSPEFLVSDR